MTILDIIKLGKVSTYLASQAVANGNLFNAYIDQRLPKMLYTETKSVEWIYNLDPNYPTLLGSGNYLYSLCGLFALQAKAIIAGGGGGTPVIPTPPSTGSIFPIYTNTASFDGSTNELDNPALVGQNLAIFVNELNQYIFAPAGFIYTPTGVKILVGDFNAQDGYPHNLIIEKVT